MYKLIILCTLARLALSAPSDHGSAHGDNHGNNHGVDHGHEDHHDDHNDHHDNHNDHHIDQVAHPYTTMQVIETPIKEMIVTNPSIKAYGLNFISPNLQQAPVNREFQVYGLPDVSYPGYSRTVGVIPQSAPLPVSKSEVSYSSTIIHPPTPGYDYAAYRSYNAPAYKNQAARPVFYTVYPTEQREVYPVSTYAAPEYEYKPLLRSNEVASIVVPCANVRCV